MNRLCLAPLLLASSILGCDGGSSASPSSSASPGGTTSGAASARGTTAAAAAAPAGPDFSPWDLDAIRTAISGTYVFKFNGSYQVWNLRGAEATLVGDVLGKKGEDTPATVEMVAPCRLRVKTGDAQKGWSSSVHQFTLKDGFFPGGSGGIGMKKGDEIVYCDGTDTVYRSGKDGCSKWKLTGKTWAREEVKCGLRDHDGKPAFWPDLTSNEPMYRCVIEGDAMFPGAFTPTPPIRVADLAAGKAKAAELEKGK